MELAVIQEISQLKVSISLADLRFADWVEIARGLGQGSRWAFDHWKEYAYPVVIKSLTLEEWEAIAEKVGAGTKWASQQFEEYRS